mmetsp:Transcript_19044/g.26587  ORF Transcript_19044/g.26587 Transcript_19044/m.26587 type:complete len:270 (+) Transcript_19044:47-856(+)
MDPKTKDLFAQIDASIDATKMVQEVKRRLEASNFLVEARDVEYRTVLHRACQVHNLELIHFLVQNYGDRLIKAKDTGGWSCFHFFIDGFTSNTVIREEVYKFVREQCFPGDGKTGATTNAHFTSQVMAKDNQDTTPLMHMCRIYRASEKATEDAEKDGDEDSDDSDSDSEAHKESKNNPKRSYTHYDVLDLLVSHYKKGVFDANVLGETALGIAQRKGDQSLLALMKSMLKHKLDQELNNIRMQEAPRAKQEEERVESDRSQCTTCVLS